MYNGTTTTSITNTTATANNNNNNNHNHNNTKLNNKDSEMLSNQHIIRGLVDVDSTKRKNS